MKNRELLLVVTRVRNIVTSLKGKKMDEKISLIQLRRNKKIDDK